MIYGTDLIVTHVYQKPHTSEERTGFWTKLRVFVIVTRKELYVIKVLQLHLLYNIYLLRKCFALKFPLTSNS